MMMKAITEEETIEKKTEEEIRERIVSMRTEENNQWQTIADRNQLKKITLTRNLIQDFNNRNNDNYKVFYVKLMNTYQLVRYSEF